MEPINFIVKKIWAMIQSKKICSINVSNDDTIFYVRILNGNRTRSFSNRNINMLIHDVEIYLQAS